MKASGKIGSNGVYVSDNVEEHFEPVMYIHICMYVCMYVYIYIYIRCAFVSLDNKLYAMNCTYIKIIRNIVPE